MGALNRLPTRAILNRVDLVSQVFKSLSHPIRLRVLCKLLDGESTVGELTEDCDVSQSSMSQFLNRMREEGLVASRREGHFVKYYIVDKKILRLLAAAKEIYC